jgi:serine/threonine-protein kinase RsbW
MPVVASVPPRPEFLHVLRAVTGGVASRMSLPVDAVDDLRLAIDEACSYLLRLEPAGRTLRLELLPSPGELRAIVSVDAQLPEWPPPSFEDSLSWKVIRGLTDGAEPWDGLGVPAIVITKRTLDAR